MNLWPKPRWKRRSTWTASRGARTCALPRSRSDSRRWRTRMKLYRVEQGSGEWYRLRLGKPTSSNFHKIVTPKGKPSKQAVKYLYRLVAERLLNETMDDEIGFVNWVAQGKEQEPYAVKQFEFVNEIELEPGGFVTTNDGRLGASPDRIFKGHKESLEIKSPAPWTQLQYLLEGPDDAYIAQTQGHLLVGDEFEALHFYSYNARTPPFHKVVLIAMVAKNDLVERRRARVVGIKMQRLELVADQQMPLRLRDVGVVRPLKQILQLGPRRRRLDFEAFLVAFENPIRARPDPAVIGCHEAARLKLDFVHELELLDSVGLLFLALRHPPHETDFVVLRFVQEPFRDQTIEVLHRLLRRLALRRHDAMKIR